MVNKEVGNPEIVLKNKTTITYFDIIYSLVVTTLYKFFVIYLHTIH